MSCATNGRIVAANHLLFEIGMKAMLLGSKNDHKNWSLNAKESPKLQNYKVTISSKLSSNRTGTVKNMLKALNSLDMPEDVMQGTSRNS